MLDVHDVHEDEGEVQLSSYVGHRAVSLQSSDVLRAKDLQQKNTHDRLLLISLYCNTIGRRGARCLRHQAGGLRNHHGEFPKRLSTI